MWMRQAYKRKKLNDLAENKWKLDHACEELRHLYDEVNSHCAHFSVPGRKTFCCRLYQQYAIILNLKWNRT